MADSSVALCQEWSWKDCYYTSAGVSQHLECYVEVAEIHRFFTQTVVQIEKTCKISGTVSTTLLKT